MMTKDEAMQMALNVLSASRTYPVSTKKAIEALTEALAQPDPEQKWIDTNNTTCAILRQLHDAIALSSLPPKREWVGLTDEEVDEAEKEFNVWRGRVAKQSFESGAWWANEKLLEKNI